ncbi:MAG: RNA polymerase sigma-70 factor [Bacteroidota bacterium]
MSKLKNTIGKKEFERIYLENHGRIWAFALRHVKDGAKAEDVVHDTFLKLWERRNQIKEIEKIETLLFTIARNILINQYRRSVLEDHKLMDMALANDDDEKEALLSEKINALKKAVEQLPAKRKQIFKMNYFQGLTYKEIADELSISKNTVEVQITKARKALKEQLSHLSTFFWFF